MGQNLDFLLKWDEEKEKEDKKFLDLCIKSVCEDSLEDAYFIWNYVHEMKWVRPREVTPMLMINLATRQPAVLNIQSSDLLGQKIKFLDACKNEYSSVLPEIKKIIKHNLENREKIVAAFENLDKVGAMNIKKLTGKGYVVVGGDKKQKITVQQYRELRQKVAEKMTFLADDCALFIHPKTLKALDRNFPDMRNVSVQKHSPILKKENDNFYRRKIERLKNDDKPLEVQKAL